MAPPKDTVIKYSTVDPEKVPGDASLELKREVVKLWPLGKVNPDHFASSIAARLELIEISVVPKREDVQVMEARVVAEIDVLPGVKLEFRRLHKPRCHIDKYLCTPGMLNIVNSTHGGCIAYLIDVSVSAFSMLSTHLTQR